MSYCHLTLENRKSIERFYQLGNKISEIAKLIGVHKSTISRELKRNPSRDFGYNAIGAQRKANKRHKNVGRKPKLSLDKKSYKFIAHGLELYFSLEKISHIMPENLRVCTSTIYRALKKKMFAKELHQKLRRYGRNNEKVVKKVLGMTFQLSKQFTKEVKKY